MVIWFKGPQYLSIDWASFIDLFLLCPATDREVRFVTPQFQQRRVVTGIVLGCFHVLAIVNSAAVTIGVHMSFSVLISSGYIPRSGIAGSHGGIIPCFLRALRLFYGLSSSPFYVCAVMCYPFFH